jgi:hypothetical protein
MYEPVPSAALVAHLFSESRSLLALVNSRLVLYDIGVAKPGLAPNSTAMKFDLEHPLIYLLH